MIHANTNSLLSLIHVNIYTSLISEKCSGCFVGGGFEFPGAEWDLPTPYRNRHGAGSSRGSMKKVYKFFSSSKAPLGP